MYLVKRFTSKGLEKMIKVTVANTTYENTLFEILNVEALKTLDWSTIPLNSIISYEGEAYIFAGIDGGWGGETVRLFNA